MIGEPFKNDFTAAATLGNAVDLKGYSRDKEVNRMDNLAINLENLSEEKQKEFEKLAEDYSNSLQLMNLFIQVNNLDFDDTWNKANQRYDEDMTHAPND